MNIKHILLSFCCIAFFYACQPSERVIERPVFGVRNSTTLEIDKVILNDTATILYVDAFFRPKYWIRIDSGTYLQAEGKKYVLTGSEGIKVHDYHWMPESGESSFKLIFPPLPRSVKKMDFIETDCKDCFRIFDIELESPTRKTGVPKEVPKELIRTRESLTATTLPEPIFNIGKTDLTIHLLGYRPNTGSSAIELYLNTTLGNQDELVANIDEQGNCRFEFQQYGTVQGIVSTKWGSCVLVLAPGESAEVYLDLAAASRNSSAYKRDDNEYEPYCYFKTELGDFNHIINTASRAFSLQTHSPEFYTAINGLDAEGYINYVMGLYRNSVDSIQAQSQASILEREFQILNNRAHAISAILKGSGALSQAYRLVNNIPWEQREIDFKAPEFNDSHFEVVKELNPTDPKLFFVQEYLFGCYGFLNMKNYENILDSKSYINNLLKVSHFSQQINNLQPLTPEQQTVLASVNPFFTEVFAKMEQDNRQQIEEAKLKTGYTICEIPAVAKEKLFDAIAERYKGKVVLVDFWTTWCGPCRSLIRSTEPLKETDLKNDNIAFVYITGESSPLSTWHTMITDIKGDHYRLSREQWNYVCDHFKIDGIPSYVLIDKAGKYKLRNDLRDHNKLKRTLLKEATL